QLYMLMYLLMFLAVIKLRVKAPDQPRTFSIPGGLFGLLGVSMTGMMGVITTLIVSFIPPDNSYIGSVRRYEITLIVGLLVMCSPPFISCWLQRRREPLSNIVELG